MNIRELVSRLIALEENESFVEISVDGGRDPKPISLVGKVNGNLCMLMNLEGSYSGEPVPDFVTRGKTRSQLVMELRSFENQELLVAVSFDDGRTHRLANSELTKEAEIYVINGG